MTTLRRVVCSVCASIAVKAGKESGLFLQRVQHWKRSQVFGRNRRTPWTLDLKEVKGRIGSSDRKRIRDLRL